MTDVSLNLPITTGGNLVLTCPVNDVWFHFCDALDRDRFDFEAFTDWLGLTCDSPEVRFWQVTDDFFNGEFPYEHSLFWSALLAGVTFGDWMKDD